MNRTFYIRTFGCQMNAADSDSMACALTDSGYSPAATPENAGIILVNTCTVRQHAEERAFSFIGDLRNIKLRNKKLKIIVAGCVASRLKEKLKKKFPYIDGIVPADKMEKFAEIIKDSKSKKPKNQKLSVKNRPGGGEKNNGTGFITITKGCSNFCSYCVVPSVRGPEISRPKRSVMSDVKNRVADGRTDITLLGQNVNGYKSGNFDFADLLTEIHKMPEIKKINFMTSHPKDMSDKIIDAIAALKKVTRRIHLPVQSGSNKILKNMNRKYTRETYLEIIEKLRKKIPGVTFTTDIIVGFPEETDADFKETLKLVKNVGYASAFTFKYSPRENTEAFLMKDNVPLEIKKKRLAILNNFLKNPKKNLYV